MYGNGSIKSVKEKKQEEQQITTLQSKASANSPNWAILNKLKEEMSKLKDKKKTETHIRPEPDNDSLINDNSSTAECLQPLSPSSESGEVSSSS